MNDQQQPQASGEQTQAGRSPLWTKLLVPALLFLGWFGGMEIGERIGSEYEGAGGVSGERIGEWVGLGVGVGTAMLIAAVVVREKAYSHIAGSTRRRATAIILLWLAFALSGVLGAVGEMYGGELGGPALFILFWLVLFAAAMLLARRGRNDPAEGNNE